MINSESWSLPEWGELVVSGSREIPFGKLGPLSFDLLTDENKIDLTVKNRERDVYVSRKTKLFETTFFWSIADLYGSSLSPPQ